MKSHIPFSDPRFPMKASGDYFMKKKINSVGIIGAGVMGATIAAHLANTGVEVILLDIIPQE